MSPREELMVPDPQFESYYGRQILKTPTWKSPDIPLYLFLGGLAGASAVLAEGAALTGRPALERVARVAAAGSAALGTVALIHDLGRPERFLSMLRVFKPTSPLSVGSFILAPFAAWSSAAPPPDVTGGLPRLGRMAGARCRRARATAGDLHRRPAANTAVPAWHEAHRELPFVSPVSAPAAGAWGCSVGPATVRAGSGMAVGGAALEMVATELMNRAAGHAGRALPQGRSGRLMRAARGG